MTRTTSSMYFTRKRINSLLMTEYLGWIFSEQLLVYSQTRYRKMHVLNKSKCLLIAIRDSCVVTSFSLGPGKEHGTFCYRTGVF